MEILSTQNQRVKQWAKYHEKKHRDADQQFLVEGEHLCEEAHQAGLLETLLVRIGCSPLPNVTCEVIEVSEAVLQKLSANKSKVDYIGIVKMGEAILPPNAKRVILLDDVQDPGNLGTIIRSALAFEVDAILLSKHCVDLYNEKVVRSTQGALFHIPILKVDLLEQVEGLKQAGFVVYATDLKAAVSLQQTKAPKRLALIFGNEGQGVKTELIQAADQNIIVEMASFESLNVAVACSICLYHYYVTSNQ
ncbi:MAG: TrmH family RNA methyltransferase [Erysipelotrichaceae bacterium]